MPSVLLVDDSAVARRALRVQLEAGGMQVLLAASAREAEDLDLSGVACAILDVELGDVDGPTLAVTLAARRPGLPVAFFTSGASGEQHSRALALGPVFRKPEVAPVVEWAKRQPPPTK